MTVENSDTNKNISEDITEKDLFGSIPKPFEIDPFDGIDMDLLSVVKKQSLKETVTELHEKELEDLDISPINPIEGVDFRDLGVQAFDDSPKTKSSAPELETINPIEGVDMADLSILPQQFTTLAPKINSSGLHSIAPTKPPLHHIKKEAKPGEKQFAVPPLPTAASEKSPKEKPIPAEAKYETKRKDPPLPDLITKIPLNRAYMYSEINRIREKILQEAENFQKKTAMIASPNDDTGSTFMVSVLGYNIAYFKEMKVLLVDVNMRRPQLHLPFGLAQENGFTEVATENLDWRAAVKHSGYMKLFVLTAGKRVNQLSLHINRTLISSMVHEMREVYDFVLFDTSPILAQNINNIDPVLISLLCDTVVLTVQEGKTTKFDLKKVYESVQKGGGKISGVIYNEQRRKKILPKIFDQFVKRRLTRMLV